MKTRLTRTIKNKGSALLATLIIGSLLSVFVVYYLSLIEQQNLLSQRSQTWSTAMAIVEAGVEEGLQALNANQTNLVDLAADGWGVSGNLCQRTQTLADGSTYSVTIDFTGGPDIYASATVQSPTATRLVQAASTAFAAIAVTAPTSQTVTRAVVVHCARRNMFTAAFVAKKNIDLNGNGILTDSFDSSDPAKSTNGKYDATKYAGDHGDIASNGGILNSVGLGNANIYGVVHTGPSCPVDIGPNGGVGTHLWQASNTGIETGYVRQDSNFTFPDTSLPSTVGLFAPSGGTEVTTSYSYGTNATTSSTYPNPAPMGGIATNTAYSTTPTYPTGSPAWVTTNATAVTVSSLPNPLPPGTITNITTTSTTSLTYPAPGSYVGGVTTNVITKGTPSQRGTWYTYNLILSKTYTYNTIKYTYPCDTYTYSMVYTNTALATNYYPYIVQANATNVLSTYAGGTILIKGANACLIMPNGLSGSEVFKLEDGASLVIYAGGSSVTINGNQVLNPSAFAGNFVVLCDPSVTSFTLNGNAAFTGVLVAPNADLTMNGSGSTVQDFSGALMVNNVHMNGHFNFHYDEALAHGPKNGRYLVDAWDEINPSRIPGLVSSL